MDSGNAVILEKISNLQSTLNTVLKQMEKYETLSDRVARIESFFKGFALLSTAIIFLGGYIYSEDKSSFIENDKRHDIMFQMIQNENKALSDRFYKYEYEKR